MPNKTNSWFWPLQITVWTITGLLNFLVQHFNQQVHFVGLVTYLNAVGMITGGLLVTSAYRYIIKKDSAPFKLQAGKFILSLLGATLLQSICWVILISLLFMPFYGFRLGLFIELAISLVPLCCLLLIWNLVYLSYHLMRRYHQTEIEKWKLEAEVQKATLGALKSQINPHFMFNALNNIRALILEDPQLARQMITKFSEIFRYALQQSEEREITVAEELRVLNQYLELVKMQYEEKLKYRINADDNVANEVIPPMILQLLVENAVKHGIALNTRGGEILIDIRKEQNQLVLNVKNTGTLKNKNELEESLGIGLKNITERLKLLYNDQASLQMSEEAPYVSVTIHIKKS